MIFVSAGHHPYRKGAGYNDWYEFDETKIWASLVANRLGEHGMVVPTGLLPEKVDFINKYGATLAVEIHFNAAQKDGKYVGQGSETLYYPGSTKGKEAAQTVQSSMAQLFQPDRGVKEGWYQMNPSKGPDYFLAKTKCIALIVEPEFIHHKEAIIASREAACTALAGALLDVFLGGT